jgi:hypothetical protein
MAFLTVAIRKTKRTLFGKRKKQDNDDKASKQEPRPQAYSFDDLTDRETSGSFTLDTVEKDTPVTVTPITEEYEQQEDDVPSSILVVTKTTITVTPVINEEEECRQEELVKTKTQDEATLRRQGEFRLDNMELFSQKLELYRRQEHDYEYDSSSEEGDDDDDDFLF